MSATTFDAHSGKLAVPDCLIDRRRPDSRYHGVYLCPNGTYRAKPRRGIHLGYFPTPTEAAREVAWWWERTYGPQWQAAFRRKCANAVVIRRQKDRMFRAWVWNGGTVDVVPGGPFLSRTDARKAADRWARDRYGLFAALSLYRTDAGK